MDFKSWAKIPRLENEVWTSTEKIDGTNALIAIDEHGQMYVGSRSQWITPQKDNHGFAQFCKDNNEELLKLGPGYHFGEWYGQGIQRNYGLKDKKLALFYLSNGTLLPKCCQLVPELIESPSLELVLQKSCAILLEKGSQIVSGFMNPEGFIIRSLKTGARYKVIINPNDSKRR